MWVQVGKSLLQCKQEGLAAAETVDLRCSKGHDCCCQVLAPCMEEWCEAIAEPICKSQTLHAHPQRQGGPGCCAVRAPLHSGLASTLCSHTMHCGPISVGKTMAVCCVYVCSSACYIDVIILCKDCVDGSLMTAMRKGSLQCHGLHCNCRGNARRLMSCRLQM